MSPSPRKGIRALASVTGALVEPYDITNVLAHMLSQAAEALAAEAVGLLVTNAHGELELLGATSHEASELEVYQAQVSEGPCVDVVREVAELTARGEDEMVDRWPTVGPTILASGARAVHAQPLRWHGRALGGLNLFFADGSRITEETTALAQAFADVATLALVQTRAPSEREVSAHIQEALDARTVVEHAKGVLVETHGLDPATAYTTVLDMATKQGLTVTEMAEKLVRQAHSH